MPRKKGRKSDRVLSKASATDRLVMGLRGWLAQLKADPDRHNNRWVAGQIYAIEKRLAALEQARKERRRGEGS